MMLKRNKEMKKQEKQTKTRVLYLHTDGHTHKRRAIDGDLFAEGKEKKRKERTEEKKTEEKKEREFDREREK